jgi:hypothetical protein
MKTGMSSSRSEISRSGRSVLGVLTSNGLPIFRYASKFSTQRLCKIDEYKSAAKSSSQTADVAEITP